MCRPDFFDVTYEINPWMKIGSVSKLKAQKQWANLAKIYEELGIEVAVIEPNKKYPDMVFATDQGIYHGKSFALSNFRYEERKGESAIYKIWLEENGYQIKYVDNRIFFEGGDCVMLGDKLILGYGFRSDLKAAKEIEKLLNLEVVPINLTNEKYYHLDTALFALNSETLFYVPSAFEASEILILSKLANLIPIDEEEGLHFTANAIVTNGHVVMTPNNPRMKKEIEKLSYKVIEVDISEFLKSGGGIHCLTLVLE